MSLRLGHIDYLNCVPFFHFLRDCGFDGEIVRGVPSALNAMLEAGQIDVSPSSSFEYGRNAGSYLLLPGQSISAVGAVRSVLLFSPCSFEEAGQAPIFITGESATSINLLRVLLMEFHGRDRVEFVRPEEDLEAQAARGQSVLAIGDRAMHMAARLPSGIRVHDLGSLWMQATGLPFVFALWIVSREAALNLRPELLRLQQAVRRSRQFAMERLESIVDSYLTQDWLSRGSLLDYWRGMSYDLTDEHLRGLRLFFRLCARHGLLEREPEIRFFH